MKLIWSENSWNDYLYWQNNDKKIVKRINTLIKEIKREPNRLGEQANQSLLNMSLQDVGQEELQMNIDLYMKYQMIVSILFRVDITTKGKL